MTFSIYMTIEIFSTDPCLIPRLKCYYYVPLRIEKYHQQRVLQLIHCSLKNHLCILEKEVDQEYTFVAHPLLQATILKSDHWVRLFEICLFKSSEKALVTNLKFPLISAYKLTLYAKLCQRPWTYPEKHLLHQE